MTSFQNAINDGGIPYFPTAANSNAYAFTFAESLGMPRPMPVLPVPGWEIDLREDIPDAAHKPMQFLPCDP